MEISRHTDRWSIYTVTTGSAIQYTVQCTYSVLISTGLLHIVPSVIPLLSQGPLNEKRRQSELHALSLSTVLLE